MTGKDHPLHGRTTISEEGREKLAELRKVEKVEKICPNCGDKNKVKPSYADSYDRKFCNEDCYGEWLSENKSGREAPNWRGGHGEWRGDNWASQRNKVRRRDSYRCCVCGDKEDDREHDVHHIIPFRKFDEPEKANRLDNLLTVCHSCHMRLEIRQPDIEMQKKLIQK